MTDARDDIDEFLNAMYDRIDDELEKAGWFCVQIACGEYSYSYTIGLTSAGLPELVTFIPDMARAYWLLDSGVRELRSRGRPPIDESVSMDSCSVPISFAALPTGNDVDDAMAQVLGYYQSRGQDVVRVDALQMVWPDRGLKFPWDAGCDPRVAAVQSRLVDWTGSVVERGALH